ncbi:MAG: alanine racemase [Gammaproteobacteria bacterium]|nr:alanine racemase [Gammaproteobacteria bacterium]
MSPKNVAHINPSAFKHNLHCVREHVGSECSIMAMIKANAYGHDWNCLQAAWAEADMLGVATLDEALQLRSLDAEKDIVLMSGFQDEEALLLCCEHHITVVVHDNFQLELLKSINLPEPIKVSMKIDTGMHRLGFSSDEVGDAYAVLIDLESVQKPFMLMTHLADADSVNHDFTEQQIELFSKLTHSFDSPKSIVNSAGILAYPDAHADCVRPGIMLYGVSPFEDKLGSDFDLRSVMTLKSYISVCRSLRKGDKIGYGCTWECDRDMQVAVVAMGYGDGYPRHVAAGTPVLIHGVECPIVGTISMDCMTVDVSGVDVIEQGDKVILWGEGLPVERIAHAADTIAYELLTQVTARVPRRTSV